MLGLNDKGSLQQKKSKLELFPNWPGPPPLPSKFEREFLKKKMSN